MLLEQHGNEWLFFLVPLADAVVAVGGGGCPFLLLEALVVVSFWWWYHVIRRMPGGHKSCKWQ